MRRKYQTLKNLQCVMPDGDPLNGPFHNFVKGTVFHGEEVTRDRNEFKLRLDDGTELWFDDDSNNDPPSPDLWPVEQVVFIMAGADSCVARVTPDDVPGLYQLYLHDRAHAGETGNFPHYLRQSGLRVYDVAVIQIGPDPNRRIVPPAPPAEDETQGQLRSYFLTRGGTTRDTPTGTVRVFYTPGSVVQTRSPFRRRYDNDNIEMINEQGVLLEVPENTLIELPDGGRNWQPILLLADVHRPGDPDDQPPLFRAGSTVLGFPLSPSGPQDLVHFQTHEGQDFWVADYDYVFGNPEQVGTTIDPRNA